jgi:hypothetical protein
MAFTGNTPCSAFMVAQWTGAIDFATDTFYIALYTNAASLGIDTAAYTATGEVVASGYTAGGVPLTVSVQPTASGRTVYVSFSDVSISAAFTARGALIYKHGGSNTAVAVLDFGADKTSTTTFTVQFPAADSTTAILRATSVAD